MKRAVPLILILAFFSCTDGSEPSSPLNPGSKDQAGAIVCSSVPSGAAIYLDSLPTGLVTPAVLDSVPAGMHAITYRKSFFQERTESVLVRGGLYSGAAGRLRQTVNLSAYYPLYVGSWWMYLRSYQSGAQSDTVRIDVVDIVTGTSGVPVTVLVRREPKWTDTLRVVFSGDTITVVDDSGYIKTVYLVPFSVGREWTIPPGFRKWRVMGVDTIVMAGGRRFACVNIEDRTFHEEPYDWNEWVSPEAGVVRRRYGSPNWFDMTQLDLIGHFIAYD